MEVVCILAQDAIGSDPLPPGQIWTISPGGQDESPGLFRVEINLGAGSGVKILNRPAPQAFTESVRYAEQNLYARGRELVGDRDPRSHVAVHFFGGTSAVILVRGVLSQ